MTESELILATVKRWYPPRRFAVCDRVSWGFGLHYEADAMALSASGVLHELEAKSRKSDLVGDPKKLKWQDPIVPDHFWYVVPPELQAVAIRQAEPRGFGVVVVSPPERNLLLGHAVRVLKSKKLHAVKYAKRTRNSNPAAELWRLCSLRYWDAVETRMELARDNESLMKADQIREARQK